MHNRARMLVASYLVKDQLIDGDQAANNGGWQWTASTGTDATPDFRIFNPALQSAKFDPDGEYIRKWVPELRSVQTKDIHAPWEKGIKARGYPDKPIVERDKQRTLNAYQKAKRILEKT